MYQPAWTKKGSVPSDRPRPAHPQPPTSSKGKGKQKKPSEPPKSKEVRRLEALLRALQESSGTDKDPKGGCFCQAREHSLSPYSSICRTCGLILCSINLPQYACPHCATPIVTAAIRSSLVVQLESQISETIAKELQGRERRIEEARKAAGAFPTLVGPTGIAPAFSPPAQNATTNQTHKVLSLNSKTKKVIVSSYNTTPVSSRPASRTESEEEEPVRLPPPPTEIVYSTKHIDRSRPWENLRNGSAKYVPLARVDAQGDTKQPGKRRPKNKGKAKENEADAAAI